jgi:hypothetical protein
MNVWEKEPFGSALLREESNIYRWHEGERTVIYPNRAEDPDDSIYRNDEVNSPSTNTGELTCSLFRRKAGTSQFLLFAIVSSLSLQGYAAGPTYPIAPDVKTTRQQTVRPVLLPETTTQLTIDQVDQYAPNGYSTWSFGDGIDAGPRLPDGSDVGTYNQSERLLSFFSISDIHIVGACPNFCVNGVSVSSEGCDPRTGW